MENVRACDERSALTAGEMGRGQNTNAIGLNISGPARHQESTLLRMQRIVVWVYGPCMTVVASMAHHPSNRHCLA